MSTYLTRLKSGNLLPTASQTFFVVEVFWRSILIWSIIKRTEVVFSEMFDVHTYYYYYYIGTMQLRQLNHNDNISKSDERDISWNLKF